MSNVNIAREERVHNVELSEEGRKLVVRELKNLDALAIQDTVMAKLNNPAAGLIVRQLWFWYAKKKDLSQFWVHKTRHEWEEETKGFITRDRLKVAVGKLEEAGLVRFEPGYRPRPAADGRRVRTTHHKLNEFRVLQLVDPARADEIEPELRHLDPDIPDVDDFLADGGGGYDDEDDHPSRCECDRCASWVCDDEWPCGEDDCEACNPPFDPDGENPQAAENPQVPVENPPPTREYSKSLAVEVTEESTLQVAEPACAGPAKQDFEDPQVRDETSPPSSPAPLRLGQRNGSDTTALTSQDSPVREKASSEGDGASGSSPTSEPSRAEMWMMLMRIGASDEELLDFEREVA